MIPSRPFRSSHSIGGVVCDFPSKDELIGYLGSVISSSSLTHIITLNAEMVVQAHQNPAFQKIIQNAELVIPDSAGIIWARNYLGQRAGKTLGVNGKTPRVEEAREFIFILLKFLFSHKQPLPGVDLIFDICEMLEKQKGTIYLMGGSELERSRTVKILQKKYTKTTIIALEDNFITERSKLTKLVKLKANSVLLVALGSPKQSFWIEEHRQELERAGVRIAMGVGGAFAMISGTLPRAPTWMRRHHLEWLWRLILEPYRIKRIWNAVIVFPLLVHKTTKNL